MKCIHAPEDKSELVGCYMQRKTGFGEQGFDFQFSDNQNLGQSFEKLQNYTENPKFPTFCGKMSLLWWAYKKVG
jgi:hypothetical protein